MYILRTLAWLTALALAGCVDAHPAAPGDSRRPAAPQISSVVAGNEQISVHFRNPDGFNDLENYDYSVDSGRTWRPRVPASIESPAVIGGLENGMTYGVMLRGVNANGSGDPSNAIVGVPALEMLKVSVIRQARRPGKSYYIPQQLDSLGELFGKELERALHRFEIIRGRKPVSLFEKVQAAADYVANMAKHPYRHNIGQEYTDPRIWENLDYPERMLSIAQENEEWNGIEWVPAPGHDAADVRAVECTFQHFMLGGIVNSLGAQWMLLNITSHDAFAYYDFEIGKWVYIESSYNEHYRLRSETDSRYTPLSPEELRNMNLAGDNSAVPMRHPYQPERREPAYHIEPYLSAKPLGFRALAVNINGRTVGSRNSLGRDARILADSRNLIFFDSLLTLGWAQAEPNEDIWAPQGEVYLDSLVYTSRGQVAHISTNFAVGSPIFEQKIGNGDWQPISSVVELGSASGEIRFRARFRNLVSGELILRQIVPDS